MSFNISLSKKILTGTRKAIAIYPGYISKLGRHTPWMKYYLSGCAGVAKFGLEILVIGLIDADNEDCISLEAIQTPDSVTLGNYDESLISWYLGSLESNAKKLLEIENQIVADA